MLRGNCAEVSVAEGRCHAAVFGNEPYALCDCPNSRS